MKATIARSITWTCSLAATALLSAPASQAQNPQEKWNEEYRGEFEVPRGIYTGRSPCMSTTVY